MDPWLELLYLALSSPHGIVVLADDPVSTKQRLYRLQRQDPTLEGLSFRTSPDRPESEIWIVKNAEKSTRSA